MRHPAGADKHAGHSLRHQRRQPRQWPQFLRIPAASATPPPWGERASALLAPYGEPARQKHYDYYDD